MLRPFCGVIMVAVVVGTGMHAQTRQAIIEYDEFMQLSVQQRKEQFRGLSGDSKAFLVRTHAQRWVAANKARLSASELAAFQEAIAFVTPRIYEAPTDPEVLKRESEVKVSMRCRVNTADAVAAFNVFDSLSTPAEKSRWSYLSQAKCWIGWFADSVVDYIPALPK